MLHYKKLHYVTTMGNLLLTGFDVFGTYTKNCTKKACEQLNGLQLENHIIQSVVLPCRWNIFSQLEPTLEEIKPIAICCTGMASRVKGIRIEQAARNIRSAMYADDTGRICNGEPIDPNGEEVLYTTINNVALHQALHNSGILVELSNDAEGFVCNDLFYNVIQYTRCRAIPMCFLHIPCTEEILPQPGVTSEKLVLPQKTVEDSIKFVFHELARGSLQ